MKSLKNKSITIVIFTILVLIFGSISGANAADTKTYTMRIAYATIGSVLDYSCNMFKEKVEAATDGRLKVELYPGAQLGSNEKCLDLVQNGVIECNCQPTAFLGGLLPILTLPNLPFLWPDQYIMMDILNNTSIGKEFAKEAEKVNLKIYGFYVEGSKQIALNSPVNTIEDVKGKKFRVMGPTLVDMVNLWGASAVPISFDAVYTALQQGMIDGIEQTLPLIEVNSFYETAPYILLTNHGLIDWAFLVNYNWYNSLPKDIDQAIQDALDSIYMDVAKYYDERNIKALTSLKEKPKVTIVDPTPEVIDQFKKASEPIFDKTIKDILGSEKYIEAFRAEVEKRLNK